MILSALDQLYDRLIEQGNPDVPAYGFSSEKISYCLTLNTQGELIDVVPLLDTSGKKPRPTSKLVPQPAKRSSGIAPSQFWDNTAYVLGLDSDPSPKKQARAAQTFEAFKQAHLELLADEIDEALVALRLFVSKWSATQAQAFKEKHPEIIGTNVVFRFESERRFIHERVAARKLLSVSQVADEALERCLVSGKLAVTARLHPSIKGVIGAQSSGASIVSFNKSSFTSYGKKQGANAPVSEKSAFAYGAALNYLLRGGENLNRLRVGDATAVFWAQSDEADASLKAQQLVDLMLDPRSIEDGDSEQTEVLKRAVLEISQGRAAENLSTNLKAGLDPNTQIFVLGLAPNAARLSIRFWVTTNLGQFSARLAEHFTDLRLDPLPWKYPPALWRLLSETVPKREGSKPKLEDVSATLAGEFARAVLTGRRYPQSLLANLLMRLRSDGHITDLRVALIKAVLTRNLRLSRAQLDNFLKTQQNPKKEIPVSLDDQNEDPGYVLGRLFAVLEQTQRAAIGDNVNATIKDRYFGAASATPNSVFPMLLRGAQNHLSKVGKTKPNYKTTLDKKIASIIDKLQPQLPKSMSLVQQGMFAIGYYHQRSEHFNKTNEETLEEQTP